MRRGKALLCAALCIILLACASCVYVRRGNKGLLSSGPLSGYAYTVNPFSRSVWLLRYEGEETDVTVPGSVRLLGIPLRVQAVSQMLFAGNERITSVAFDGGVSFLSGSMRGLFEGCTSLLHADLTGADTRGVTDMTFLFRGCSALVSADMTGLDTSAVETIYGMLSGCSALERLEGYERFDTGSLRVMSFAFNDVRSLARVDLRAWDLDQLEASAWCFQRCGAQEILLPDNLAVISAGFMNHAAAVSGDTFTIPAGVKRIGYAHTFYDFAGEGFTCFAVQTGNSAYRTDGGLLCSADGTELLAVPRGMTFEDGVFEISEGVTFLPELCFSRNRQFHTLVLPDSYEIRQFVPLNDPQYTLPGDGGNINAGNSLSIALYMYTSVTDYAVKAGNPCYAARDGVIYSWDMRELVAVPARYNRTLDIPEGVRVWNTYAMWAEGSKGVDALMDDCPGVYIPASMTEIAQDQIDMLNRLRQNRTDGAFRITVSPDNAAYGTDGDGYLYQKETQK